MSCGIEMAALVVVLLSSARPNALGQLEVHIPAAETIMETYIYPHFPQDLSAVYVALFTGVSNAAQLRRRLITAASMAGDEGELERENVNFAFIDARKVCSRHRSLPDFTTQSLFGP